MKDAYRSSQWRTGQSGIWAMPGGPVDKKLRSQLLKANNCNVVCMLFLVHLAKEATLVGIPSVCCTVSFKQLTIVSSELGSELTLS